MHTRPSADEFQPFYGPYLELVPDGDVVEHLRTQGETLVKAWRALPDAARGYRYATGKWTVEEVIGHVVDVERVFSYRAMCFLRQLPAEQPGVDQDIMVPNSRANERGLDSWINEFEHLRASNAELFGSLTDDECMVRGRASGGEVTVRAVIGMIYGHAQHHANVLSERYQVER